VFIGGTPGSGTKLVAEILKQCGVFIGGNLNKDNDNMDFVFCLSGRTTWINRHFPFKNNYNDVEAVLALFEKIYFNKRLSIKDYGRIIKIGTEYFKKNDAKLLTTRPLPERIIHALRVFRFSLKSEIQEKHTGFAVKCPNTLFFVEPLLKCYPEMKFVHVVRDGRDMALSQKQKMLFYLAPVFELDPEYDPANSLLFWSRINRYAYDTCGQTMPPENYMLLRYEDLCMNASDEIARLFDFLGIQSPFIEKVCSLPRENPSIGRWEKEKDVFAKMPAEDLNLFGYK